jgi:HlyD family secretion protein
MKKIVIAAVVLASLAGLGWWGAQAFMKGSPPVFRTAAVKKGGIVSVVSSTGTLTPVVNVQVGTPVSGIVKALYVDYNSLVKTGEPIAQIDPAVFNALAQQAYGAREAAVSNVAKAKAAEEDAKRTMERYSRLVNAGLVARSDFDAAETAWKSGKAARQAAEAAVLQAQGAYEQARTNLEYSTVRSPVDGIVISRNVDVGQTVAASLQSPTLFVIAQDLTRMEIDANVDEADVSKIKEGTPAVFTVDAYPETRFQGIVNQVRNSPVTVQNVVTYVVVINVDNSDLRLKPGMTANVTFEVASKQGALIAPNAALRFKPAEGKPGAAGQVPVPGQIKSGQEPAKRVYVLGSRGEAKAVSVRTGIGNDRETEIISGELKEGDEVIVEQLGLKRRTETGQAPFGPRF